MNDTNPQLLSQHHNLGMGGKTNGDMTKGSGPDRRKKVDLFSGRIPTNHLVTQGLTGGTPIPNRLQSPRFPSTSLMIDDTLVMPICLVESYVNDDALSAKAQVHYLKHTVEFVKEHGVRSCPKNSAHAAPATTFFSPGPNLPTGDLTHNDDPGIPPNSAMVEEKLASLGAAAERRNTTAYQGKKKTGNATHGRGQKNRQKQANSETKKALEECKDELALMKKQMATYMEVNDARTDAGIKKMEKAVKAGVRKMEETEQLALVKQVTRIINDSGLSLDATVLFEAVKKEKEEKLASHAVKLDEIDMADSDNSRAKGGDERAEVSQAQSVEAVIDDTDGLLDFAPGTGITSVLNLTEVNREEGTPAKNPTEALQFLKRRRQENDEGQEAVKKMKTSD